MNELCEICAFREHFIPLGDVMFTVCSDRDDDCPGFKPMRNNAEEKDR